MSTTMRTAFEACTLPANPTEGQLKLAKRIVNRMGKQDDAAAQRKRVRTASAVSKLQQQ